MKEDIIKLLSEILPHIDFNSDDRLVDDGLLDSLSIVQIVSVLSDKYNVEFDLDHLAPCNFNSIDSIVETVRQLEG